jgi:hypothetical protein
VGYSEEWLKVLDEAERSKLPDSYTPAYARHWSIDPKYDSPHYTTLQRNATHDHVWMQTR